MILIVSMVLCFICKNHKSSDDHLYSAIVTTGGVGAWRSFEVLRENGSYWCSLPDLPDDRLDHSQSGLMSCGGGDDTMTSCVTFSDGLWLVSHQLQNYRKGHSSWMSQHGVMLLGGVYSESQNTTEILTSDGGSIPGFTLKYST